MISNDSGMFMPVAPAAYGNGNNNGSFGGDWGWIILLLLLAGGGWGNYGFGGGFGGGNYDFPWILTGQQNINTNTNNGFRDAMLNDGITSIRDGIAGLSTQLCGCCSDMQMALANGFSGVEQGANARQMADMQQMFSLQSALQNCCCENRSNIADLKYTVATENCADRQTINEGVRDILASQSANTQRILDQMCQDKIDSKNEKIADLERQLSMATLKASQVAQTAEIQRGQVAEVDALYQRLATCPVGTMPVYGNQPIFTCPNQNNGCGCGCGNF